MPSLTFDHCESMEELRPHQDEFLHLAELSGIYMDKDIFRCLVQLLNMGVSPNAVFSLLKIIKKKKTDHVKSRKSHSSYRSLMTKHK